MKIEAKLAELGLVLPEPLVQPPGARLPFPWVRIRGQRAFIKPARKTLCFSTRDRRAVPYGA
jgi:hypothetical protein